VKREEIPLHSDAALDLLRAILAAIEGLREDVRTSFGQPNQVPPDPLLLALREVVGTEEFTTAGVLDVAEGPLLDLTGSDANAFGRKLAKLEGHGVECVGRDSSGMRWRLT
jgi:hypothetical protein